MFGDEVVDYIAVGSHRPIVDGRGDASLATRGDDINTLQLLQV